MWKSFTDALVVTILAATLAACGGTATVREVPATAESLPEIGDPPAELPEVRRANQAAFERAIAAMRENRMSEAEGLLRQITTDQPELSGPWINLGQVYVALGQPEDARAAFQKAIRANPRNCTAYNELAVLSRRYGDFAGAESLYQTCIELQPDFKDAYLNLGILYELYLGKLPEALEYYRAYQSLLDEPDRRVQGWVVDLERRLGV